jgi:leucyl-tRNA synthetase
MPLLWLFVRCVLTGKQTNLASSHLNLTNPRFRSEKLWKVIGKEGFAVQAPWPHTQDEDKILTRQAALLRKVVKQFRNDVGRAKKGWTKGSILVTNEYPDWKVDVLKWMKTQYTPGEKFSATFVEDLKGWTAQNISDKKQIKFAMQFASFRKREVEDVGEAAMDIQLPFDQKETFVVSLAYMKAQLAVTDLDVLFLSEAPDVPSKVADQVEPGTPVLWLR